jgi:hypothetical protein
VYIYIQQSNKPETREREEGERLKLNIFIIYQNKWTSFNLRFIVMPEWTKYFRCNSTICQRREKKEKRETFGQRRIGGGDEDGKREIVHYKLHDLWPAGGQVWL